MVRTPLTVEEQLQAELVEVVVAVRAAPVEAAAGRPRATTPRSERAPGVADRSALAGIAVARSSENAQAVFLSATNAEVVAMLDAKYWHRWLTTPVDFKGALDHVANISQFADEARRVHA